LQKILSISQRLVSSLACLWKKDEPEPEGRILLYRFVVWTHAATYNVDFYTREEANEPNALRLDKEIYGNYAGTSLKTIVRAKDGKDHIIPGFLWDDEHFMPQVGAAVYRVPCRFCGAPVWSAKRHTSSICPQCIKPI